MNKKKPRDSRDSRDTRKAEKPFIVYPPPYRMEGSGKGERVYLSMGRKRKIGMNALCDGLRELVALAAADTIESGLARIDLYRIAFDLVSRMNRQAQEQPEQWRRISEGEVLWPVIASLHPHYVKGMKQGAAIRDFLKLTLHLGENHCVSFKTNAKSDLHSPITRTAIELIQQVAQARGLVDSQHEHRLSGWRRKANALPPPVKSNAEQWADVAMEALLESYPHPEQIRELADEIGKHWESWKTKDSKNEAPSHRESPGRIGDRIKRRLHTTICKLLVDVNL